MRSTHRSCRRRPLSSRPLRLAFHLEGLSDRRLQVRWQWTSSNSFEEPAERKMDYEGFPDEAHPALPPEGSNESAFCAGRRQVFGLAGSETFLLAVASQFA